jgi:LPXTG-motif cell wall-anchored protein
VVGFGWGQGTYNAGTVARINHVKFAGKGVCQVHDWKKGAEPSPSQSVSPSPSVTPSTTASASASPSTTETSAAPGGVAGGDEPSLPVTGASTSVLISGAAALLAIGGVLLLVTRMRRRTRFSA